MSRPVPIKLRRCRPGVSREEARMKNHFPACEHCIDCFFLDQELPEDGGRELCILDPDHPVEVNYSDKACSHFELSDTAAAERSKTPGEL